MTPSVLASIHAHGGNNLKETKADLHLSPADVKSSPVPTIMNYTCKYVLNDLAIFLILKPQH